MEVEKAIHGRRSIRKYSDQDIEGRLLEKVLEAAVWAPTASNAQSWVFICVTDPATVHRIKVISPGIFWEPKALICVCSDQQKAGRSKTGPLLAVFDCAMASQNMMLRAFDLGLGTCAIRSTNMEALREIVKAPPHIQPELLIEIGYPADDPKAPARNHDIIFWDRYGKKRKTHEG
jgi:nitroreductase